MKIKIDAADKTFSQYIRKRDKKCVRCQSPVQFNDKGLPVSHQCSHYWGRGHESTRFDLENADCLCFYCHSLWGGEERDRYKEFKIKQLGPEGFKRLDFRAHQLVKKDRKKSLIISRELLKSLKVGNLTNKN
jgi:hypothetical protein